VEVRQGTIAVWSDIGCPWAHIAVYRLHETRARLRLERRVALDHRAFPLELFNSQPTPKPEIDAEAAALSRVEPGAGWEPWSGPEWTYPVTTLPALEAVQAAKEQGMAASEELDRGLRLALFGQSRCVSMRHVILEVASECDSVDVDALRAALDAGTHRRRILEDWQEAGRPAVRGSPHLFLADGTDAHNPGLTLASSGDEAETGLPAVERDDPSVYVDLLRRAAR
jgi:predicted DsbA family dithiol-disulfide isomerase